VLKPQDVVLAVKLLCKGDEDWSQGSLAQELVISASEINAGLKRLDKCGFIEPHADGRRWLVVKSAFREFMLHGIAYVFPAQKGGPCTGLLTAYAHQALSPHFDASLQALAPVWPDRQAKSMGFTFEPLYPTVAKACIQDVQLYEWLAIIDCLRDRANPEVEVARVLLRDKLSSRKKRVAKSNQTLNQAPSLKAKTLEDHQLDLLAN